MTWGTVALVDYLETDASVGAEVGDRIFPLEVPAGTTYPAIRVQGIDTSRELAHDGPTTLARPRIQVDHYGTSWLNVINSATAVRKALDGFRGSWGSLEVGKCALVDEREGREFEAGPSGETLYRISQDYDVEHQEAVA